MGEKVDHATIAFRLALAEAITNEQTRVDALLALWQRSVLVATWPGPNEAARTLNNSHSESALPLFTGIDTLEVAASRFGWREPDGSLRFRELPAPEALRHALVRQVNFVVMDVGFEHSVEFAREELEPLLSQIGTASPQMRDRQAAVLEAVRRNSRPPPKATPMPAPPPHSLTRALVDPVAAHRHVAVQHAPAKPRISPPPPPASPKPPSPPPPPSAAGSAPAPRTPGASPSPVPARRASPPPAGRRTPSTPGLGPPGPTLAAHEAPAAQARTPSEPRLPPPDPRRRIRDDEPTLAERPNRANGAKSAVVPDSALQALSSELRGFPEVEWACVLSDESEVPLIGVRVDPSFLNRVADITDVILDVGERQSLTLQVLLLNNQDQVKNARRNGRAFYPWTR